MNVTHDDPIILPVATIQHDFLSVVSDVRDGLVPEDKFWLSCYKDGEPSVHAKVVATLDDIDRDLVRFEGVDGVVLTCDGENSYSATCSALHIPATRLATPIKAFAEPALPEPRRSRKITSFDVAPDGSQFATGHYDGHVYIRSTLSESVPVITSRPHLSTVTSLQFFPSSRVLLTAGSDFALTILSAEPLSTSSPAAPTSPSPVRTLRGHSRGVTSTAIISRGRNVLSASKDGTVRLWDVPSGEQIRMLTTGDGSFTAVNALSVDAGTVTVSAPAADPAGTSAASAPDADIDPREIDTADKLAFCALQSGAFEVLDLRAKRSIYRSATGTGTPLQAIAYAPAHGLLATGSARGVVEVYDARSLARPQTAFRRNTAAIEDLAFVALQPDDFASPSSGAEAGVGLAIATEDGLPYVADVRPGGPNVRAELVGQDCDPVHAVRVVQGLYVWTTADDGVVRQYRMR
ncbi:WD40 repeat-like protein [Wolfiporia cocos MD-104 SS10]|uniref:WD40 repeat-like protein n=1 Tax=Wolfiporia cocos (strain MD-104) TaxID=742152 RepID=A0A2H3JMA2_WOLCO|nr:WD40 repeat-like protein [Wolfiporia cocos MD-104 SS10]